MGLLCCLQEIDASSVLLFIFVLILASVLMSWMGRPKNLPPSPATPYPLLGHLPYLKKGVREIIEKWTKQKGEIFSLYFGTSLVVVLSSYDVIKEAFLKQADSFSHRPLTLLSKSKGYKEGKGLLLGSGDVWKTQRALSTVILRQFGMGKNHLAVKIQEELSYFLDELATFKGNPKEVRALTNKSVSNNICSIVLGKRFDYDDREFMELIETMDSLFVNVAKPAYLFGSTALLYVPGDLFGLKKTVAVDARLMQDVGQVNIDKAKHRIDSADETDNYILAYLREMKKKIDENQETHLNELNLKYNTISLFIAGTDTTSTTLLWFMMYMIHFPNVQKKVYKEILDIVGSGRAPSMTDKPQMNYLNAVIMEVQRIASIVPLGVAHETCADTTLRGYFIPKGTRIISNLDAVLYDEKVWKDPKKFNPDNFLDENGSLHVPEQFIPFSIGRRVCIGESLAKMELFLYTSALIQRFELKPADPTNLPPMAAGFGATCPPKPFDLRFIERNF